MNAQNKIYYPEDGGFAVEVSFHGSESERRYFASKSLTVQNLRNNGYSVKVRHMRFLKDGKMIGMSRYYELFPSRERKKHLIDPRGGCTIVEITSPDGSKAEAEANCSQEDNYNRKHGLHLALLRAWRKLNQRKSQDFRPSHMFDQKKLQEMRAKVKSIVDQMEKERLRHDVEDEAFFC